MRRLLLENKVENLKKVVAEEVLKGNFRRVTLTKIVSKRAGVSLQTAEEFLKNLRKRGILIFSREFVAPTSKGLIYFSSVIQDALEEVGKDGH